MVKEHRYILEPYGPGTKVACPECGTPKKFTRFIDTKTGEHVADAVGRCDREDSCGYNYTPSQYFKDTGIEYDGDKRDVYFVPPAPPKPVSYIPIDYFKASLTGYSHNNFTKYLANLFNADIADSLIAKYFIGTSKHWPGANVFWQIDIQGKVRSGKVMQYSPSTGKRDKEPCHNPTWVHTLLRGAKNAPFNLGQVFFGEHLLKDSAKPVAIVESEKTALIASVYLPSFIWLAAGGKNGINSAKCKYLKGRNVTLFPDLNAYDKWIDYAAQYSHIATFTVSDLLERKATTEEREQGLDLADHLIRFNYRVFIDKPATASPISVEQVPGKPVLPIEVITVQEVPISKGRAADVTIPASWLKEVEEIEYFLASAPLPDGPIRLSNGQVIGDTLKFTDSHLSVLKANDGRRVFRPFLDRLKEFKDIIESRG